MRNKQQPGNDDFFLLTSIAYTITMLQKTKF
jgi:hypothetical protein